jgi:hypothetical protein
MNRCEETQPKCPGIKARESLEPGVFVVFLGIRSIDIFGSSPVAKMEDAAKTGT